MLIRRSLKMLFNVPNGISPACRAMTVRRPSICFNWIWLPRWRPITKPTRSNAAISRLDEIRGSLGILPTRLPTFHLWDFNYFYGFKSVVLRNWFAVSDERFKIKKHRLLEMFFGFRDALPPRMTTSKGRHIAMKTLLIRFDDCAVGDVHTIHKTISDLVRKTKNGHTARPFLATCSVPLTAFLISSPVPPRSPLGCLWRLGVVVESMV